MNAFTRAVRRACEWLGVVEPDPMDSEPPPSPDGLQPLPPTLDDLHVPETRPYRCTECGEVHEAVLQRILPLGVTPGAEAPEVQLTYRAAPCPNAPEPSTAPTPEPTLEGTPRVWRDEEDGT